MLFSKFRVKAAMAKFITMNRLHSQTLQFFEDGLIDAYIDLATGRGLDANQGAVAVITATITDGASNGALSELKKHLPHIYQDLYILWQFCGSLLIDDEQRWGRAIIVGKLECNPFEYAESLLTAVADASTTANAQAPSRLFGSDLGPHRR